MHKVEQSVSEMSEGQICKINPLHIKALLTFNPYNRIDHWGHIVQQRFPFKATSVFGSLEAATEFRKDKHPTHIFLTASASLLPGRVL